MAAWSVNTSTMIDKAGSVDGHTCATSSRASAWLNRIELHLREVKPSEEPHATDGEVNPIEADLHNSVRRKASAPAVRLKIMGVCHGLATILAGEGARGHIPMAKREGWRRYACDCSAMVEEGGHSDRAEPAFHIAKVLRVHAGPCAVERVWRAIGHLEGQSPRSSV